MSSAWPSATVMGVRSSCEASWMNCRSRSSRARFASDTRWTSSIADSLRRACHTIATNIAAIRGTSVNSSIGCTPRSTSMSMKAPVVNITAASVHAVDRTFHTRNPYRRVTLTQMKWNGTVSHDPNTNMANRLRRANAPQATSIQCLRSADCRRSGAIDPISFPADGLDQVRSQLRSKPPNVDVHDIGAGVEVISPNGIQQALLGHRLAGVFHQLLEEKKLAFGEEHRAQADVGRAADHVEG